MMLDIKTTNQIMQDGTAIILKNKDTHPIEAFNEYSIKKWVSVESEIEWLKENNKILNYPIMETDSWKDTCIQIQIIIERIIKRNNERIKQLKEGT